MPTEPSWPIYLLKRFNLKCRDGTGESSGCSRNGNQYSTTLPAFLRARMMRISKVRNRKLMQWLRRNQNGDRSR